MRCNGCNIIIGVVLNLSGCCCGVGDILDRVACKSAHILLRLTVALIHLAVALVYGSSVLLYLPAKLSVRKLFLSEQIDFITAYVTELFVK